MSVLPEYLTLDEVADILRVNRQAASRTLEKVSIAHFRSTVRRLLHHCKETRTYIESHGHETPNRVGRSTLNTRGLEATR